MNKLFYGVAYYDEYMPYERLSTDIEMMKEAGINLVRIAESTWSTHEPQNGVFDFSSVDRVLDAMHEAGIHVIVGTPTYAVPTWMVKEHPDVLAETPDGPGRYGARQIMDITNPSYLFYSERIIRKLISRVCGHPAVIGYQVDNETKHYRTSGPNVQLRFVKYMREKFGTVERLNEEFGLDYWSNRINSWEDFPSAVGTINGSLGAEFARFQRQLVTDFLAWQASIVNEYKRPGQFVTHNFDFEWRGYSFGVQPDVDHFEAAKALDIAGVDIYHPSQDDLTGKEISFGGDSTRSLKGMNYFVLETQAQAFPNWTPYPGQLLQQAFSHLASGANMVEYWHWHSIHNSFETYWKGLLSHDLGPNPTYNEARIVGRQFARLSDKLVNLKKTNRAAVLVSNEALTSLDWFKLPGGEVRYNDIVRLMYDRLYEMNIGCDILHPGSIELLGNYDLIVVPALYAASGELLEALNRYVENGGHVVYTFKSGFANEHIKVRTGAQPGLIEKACGIRYSQFAEPSKVSLKGNPFGVGESDNNVEVWMELLTPTTAEVLAWYDHPHWGQYAAITTNRHGEGVATYIGCLPSEAAARKVLEGACREAGIWGVDQELQFPVIVKTGTNESGKTIRYYFNYSDEPQSFVYPHGDGAELLGDLGLRSGETIELERWGVAIVEEA
ncbi:beta-galactosidase [Paenibacillus sp. JDR-2]|uniref:beta-galactosidase n=1 Tax=Paenibacillus sp. (strain JDR-2) TaxID=324057 RepID=UPI0001668FFA|nr:beta-galactosidase [Paenibacillus sp. JDR-2]ACS99575.1 Beta-galactosidase [Paenibacillus sp. JDR-2]